jgi:VTC domain-containing protein
VTLEAAASVMLSADQAMTADRNELTYLVPRRGWQGLVQYFDEWLPAHRYRGEGENPLPAPQHFVSTVYFDTPSGRLLRAAQSRAHDNVKLRAKEYYDVHPSLAELATSVEEVVHAPGELWFELKRRSGVRTQKHRICLSKSVLSRWLVERGELNRNDYVGREADARVLEQYLEAESEPLGPACVVNYQRCSWQSELGDLRVTLDSNLAFYVPPADLFRRRSFLREGLGAACAQEPSALLEVKHRAEQLPAGLSTRLEQLGLAPADYSKFVTSASAVQAYLASAPVAPHV